MYEGDIIDDDFKNVIESTYGGKIGLKRIEIAGNYAKIDLEVLMSNTYCKNSRVYRKNELLNVSVSRNIGIQESYRFSVLAATCKSCGGNFDSATQKICPYCGCRYDFRDDDWMITKLTK